MLIKPILGYFTTLDPLGFSLGQLDTLFLVLGTMATKLGSVAVVVVVVCRGRRGCSCVSWSLLPLLVVVLAVNGVPPDVGFSFP